MPRKRSPRAAPRKWVRWGSAEADTARYFGWDVWVWDSRTSAEREVRRTRELYPEVRCELVRVTYEVVPIPARKRGKR